MGKAKLDQSRQAYFAVCEMLTFTGLSDQTERCLQNLRVLLELEISALESKAAIEAAKDPKQT